LLNVRVLDPDSFLKFQQFFSLLADVLLLHGPFTRPLSFLLRQTILKKKNPKTNPSQNKCVFSSENFFYHQTKRIKDDLCVFLPSGPSLRTPFFSCVVWVIESDQGGHVSPPNGSCVTPAKQLGGRK
jgi:hypothetical protein